MEHAHHKHHGHHKSMEKDFRNRFIVSLILTVPIILLSETIRGLLGINIKIPYGDFVSTFISTIIFFYGGYPFFKGFKDEMVKRSPGMMTLITLAITVAYVYSIAVVIGFKGSPFFWELATLIDIMLLGHWIEMRSVMGASRALEKLSKLLPSHAILVDENGETRKVHIRDLKVGHRVLVQSGERIPLDGIVIDGKSYVDESMLTGESKPVEKSKGSNVIGGSLVLDGYLIVEIKKVGKDTYIQQVMEIVKRAQESRSKTQDLANRFARYLTVLAVLVGVITFTVWIVLGQNPNFAINRAVTVMVISCPHALGLAIPLVVAVSTAIGASRGLLVRNREAFERARNINVVVFDKTGTLTYGRFEVSEIVSLGDKDERDILSLAASLEINSSHPIAKAIVEYAKKNGVKFLKVEDFKTLPGKGVEGKINGKVYRLLNPKYVEGVNVPSGKTSAVVVEDNKPLGIVILSDKVRPESKEAIKKLSEMGIKCVMITGDNEAVASAVAGELNITEYYAGVMPHEKAEKIKEIKGRGFKVAMVGDGINDAPALVEADVGIAIGTGTDIAIESADIILVKDNPLDVVFLFKLSKATYRKMVQNLFWATFYNVFAIPLAAGVLYPLGITLTPATGALLMSLSTVIVAINSRFLRV
ncbi:MAG: copper-translocating P-type ATPase [candidate division WOR-3 bacterium]